MLHVFSGSSISLNRLVIAGKSGKAGTGKDYGDEDGTNYLFFRR
jgi:hypothetical protein